MGFKFPIPPGYATEPIWTGNGFLIGSEKCSVLKYTECEIGWDASLTDFHEKEAEDGRHYIDQASRLHACNELKNKVHTKSAVILEIGSSSGYLLREIKMSFPDSFLIGSDCIPEPLEKIAQKRPDIPLIQFDLVNCPLPDKSVNVVIALNVLEHIKDDTAALKQIYRILKPGGYAIIEVPANQELFDFYDEQLKHFRRYNLRDLCNMALKSHFVIVSATHLGFFLYPFFSFIKKRNKRMSNSSEKQKKDFVKKQIALGGKIIHKMLDSLMNFEILIGKKINFPFGIRCCVLLQRADKIE
jgi:ubiquinone/menaquinone biosynthesis C-methylase UbiE